MIFVSRFSWSIWLFTGENVSRDSPIAKEYTPHIAVLDTYGQCPLDIRPKLEGVVKVPLSLKMSIIYATYCGPRHIWTMDIRPELGSVVTISFYFSQRGVYYEFLMIPSLYHY